MPSELDLAGFLADARLGAIDAALDGWPELGGLLDRCLPDPMDPYPVLTLATASAWGGDVQVALEGAVALVLFAAGLRLLDDVADDDDPNGLARRVGPGRAANAAAAWLVLASGRWSALGERVGRPLGELWRRAAVEVLAGQDRDLRAGVRSWAEYERLIARKTEAAFGFAAAAGAHLAGAPHEAVRRAEACGRHVGRVVQLLDDVEATWPTVTGDLEAGKLTAPVFLALSAHERPERARVAEMAADPRRHAAALRDLVERMGARRAVVVAAVEARDVALACLADAPHPRGRQILSTWMDFVFRDAERLAGMQEGEWASHALR